MILIDKMKNLKIYRIATFLPTLSDNKKMKSAILLLTPNYESSRRLMNHRLFINNRRYSSYYLEKDISFYIGSKDIEEVDGDELIKEFYEANLYLEMKRSEIPDDMFGVPSKRKFPLDTEARVRSAIKFFNYVDPEDEEELARRIIAAMKKFNITDVHVSKKNRFSKYYTNPEDAKNESVEIVNEVDDELSMNTEEFLKAIPESALNIGDKVLFFNEDANDNQLRKLLFKRRIRYRKELLLMLDKVKADNNWIKFAFPELKRLASKNVYIDLYYYNALFFENNIWKQKRGMNLYSEFMNRLLNHPNIKDNGYTKKTIFIPIEDWDMGHNGNIWNYRVQLSPISIIYQMMFDGQLNILKKTFGDNDVLFIGRDQYFKINFFELDQKDMRKLAIKFRVFVQKICNREQFDEEDIDTSAENIDSKEAIQNKISDKIELSRGVDITKQLNKANKDIEKEKEKDIMNKLDKNHKIINNTNSTLVAHNAEKRNKELIKTITKIDIEKNATPQTKDNKEKIAKEKELKKQEIEKSTKSKLAKNAEEEDDFNINNSNNDEDIEKLARAISIASDNNDNEEDALNDLDDDEIKKIIINLSGEDEVDISPTRAARIDKLNNDLLDKEINGKTINDILSDTSSKEEVVTKLDIASPNDEWNELKFVNFDKNYNIDKDIVSIFKHFSDCSRPISIRNIEVTDSSTSEDHTELYTVQMEDYRGVRFTIKLDIPIMEDNRFLLRGNYNTIQTQFFNMPIIKTEVDTCQLISNYNKIFLYRFGTTVGKSTPIVSRLVKAANKYTGRKIKFTTGYNIKVSNKYQLLIDYVDLSSIFSYIETEDYIFYFNQDEIREKYTLESGKGFPYAYHKPSNSVLYYADDQLEFDEFLLLKLYEADPNFKEVFDSTTRANSCMFTRASIMSSKIPLIIICGYYIGLRSTMDRAGIKYTIEEKLTKDIRTDYTKDWIKFEDGYIVYSISLSANLLMNGLKECSTDLFKIGDIDSKNMYLEFLDNYGGRIKADGLDNFRDLFVDPMIKESLEYYKLPTDFVDILLYGNQMMADNKYIKHTDTSSRKLRRYQLIAAYTYKVLSTAYAQYSNMLKHNSNNATFEVKRSAVIDMFLTDNITSPDSIINALRDVETTNAITTKGPSGMNSDRAYSLDKRAYDESMINVLGMSTGFAGNVGITRQTTIDANVTPDGYVKNNEGDTENMNDANTMTATESIIPLSATHDDPMRIAMSFIQTSKHSVRTEDADPLLVTNGADEVMPYLTTNRFAYKAKMNGKIIDLNEHYILVEYDDGTKDYINLDEVIEHNSDGGYYVPLKLDAVEGLKKGMKIKENQILAYDHYSFSNSLGESDNIAYNVGKLAKVAIINSDEGFEDSGIISQSMAEKLATRIDIKYDAVINKDSKIFKMMKVGDHVEASDSLIIWEDTFDDEDAADMMAALSNDETDFSELGKRKLKSEVTGTIKAIKIYRTVELEEMSDSVRKVVREYEKPIKELAKVIKDNNLSISKVPAHYVLPPTGKLKKAQNAIYVEFFVEYLDTVGVGDKVVFNAANKAVEKAIYPPGMEPYTAFRPREIIDGQLSETSISKRLVNSIISYGALQKLMIELDRSVKDIMGIEYDDSKV